MRLLLHTRAIAVALLWATLTWSGTAQAIPAFARKYGTSCETCHTVYPKLTPFGEAFRRNGYRFPGMDSDFVKQPVVPLGQDAEKKVFPSAVWPATLPASVPIAVGFNGTATTHPNVNSSAGVADNGTAFTLQDLVAEAHLWAGGSFDDRNTFWAELTFSSEGTEVEHAQVLFNDLGGLPNVFNLVVGRGSSTISSFGPHSSYVGDALLPAVPVTALYGSATPSFSLGEHFNGVELNGIIAGRVDYAVGLNAGTNVDVRPTQNLYAHLGLKLGGMRLDGVGSSGPADPARPWAENALTLDGFAYRSSTHFLAADGPDGPITDVFEDVATTLGGGLRAQWGSLELNSGVYVERHDNALGDGTAVNLFAQYNELSYVVFPWLVPAVRVEFLSLTPSGGPAINDVRIIPGIAALIRPNLKLSLVAQLESSSGAPPGGWGPAGGFAAPEEDATVPMELESVALNLFTAF